MKDQLFDARLDLVPQNPGVYLMKNAQDSIIYIGKAINLRKRLSSYFQKQTHTTYKVHLMVSQVADFDFVICESELEALILESNLIKRYQPFYNILLKDDHDYPYIKVSLQEDYPRVTKAYRIGADVREGAQYFGPYLTGNLNAILDIIHEIFPIKKHHRIFPRKAVAEDNSPYGVNPSLDELPKEEYREHIQDICLLLKGNYTPLIEKMQKNMEEASQVFAFEKAAIYRDRLLTLTNLKEKQYAVTQDKIDYDILAILGNETNLCLQKLEQRKGKITGVYTYFLEGTEEDASEKLFEFIQQSYLDTEMPKEILVNLFPQKEETNTQILEAYLKEIKKKKIHIACPSRGEKKKLVDMAVKTAKEALQRKTLMNLDQEETAGKGYQILGKLLGFKDPIARIEAYDISNMGSEAMTCGMIVYENAVKTPKAYRRFTIKKVEEQNDYASMQEAVSRRLDRLGDENFGKEPQVLLIDGGKGHVQAVKHIVQEKQKDILVVGMVKDKRHKTRGIVLPDGSIIELSIKDQPGESPILNANERMALLRFLTQVQNEVHRYALAGNQKLRTKKHLKYELESIPGVGPKKRMLLLKAFRRIKDIQVASVDDLLEKVPELGVKTAQNISDYFAVEKLEKGKNT